MTVTPIGSGPEPGSCTSGSGRSGLDRQRPRSLRRLPGPAEGTSVGEAAIEFSSREAGGVRVVPQHLAGSDLLGTADELRTRDCAVGAIRGHKIRLLPQGVILACSAASKSAAAKQGGGPSPVAWHTREFSASRGGIANDGLPAARRPFEAPLWVDEQPIQGFNSSDPKKLTGRSPEVADDQVAPLPVQSRRGSHDEVKAH
jgi:hypothetical protein